MPKYSETQKIDAIARLRELLPAPRTEAEKANYKPRPVVYALIRHVARSGMSREISMFVVHEGQLCGITWEISALTNLAIGPNDGVRIGGCGMDMRFALLDCFIGRVFDGANANDYQIDTI